MTGAMTLSLCTVLLLAQRPDADQIETTKGPLSIQPVQHASIVFTWNGKTIYVDPNGSAKLFDGLASPDIIFITDIHGDHYNTKTLEELKAPNAVLVVPKAVADLLPENLKANAMIMSNDETQTKMGMTITALPMYNLPETADSRHPKGRGNGYVIDFGGKRVYISGDTEDIPEMRTLKDIDVAFVCMNLPYTMDIHMAASAVVDFKPKIIYPYHYRGQGGLSDTAEFKKLVGASDKNIDVRLRNWYAE